MLLGVNDVVVRWWRDERFLDGSYCDPPFRGENSQRPPRVARSQRWSYRRRLVANSANVHCRAFADIRRGARGVQWVGLVRFPPGHASQMFALGH